MSQQPAPILPEIVNVANYARSHKLLKKRTGLLNGNVPVDFFRLKRLVRALQSPEFAQHKNMPLLETSEDVTQLVVRLIENKMIVPVDKMGCAETRQQGFKPVRGTPSLLPALKANMSNPELYFIWVYNKPNPFMILYSILAIAGVFTVLLFPLWPMFMRRGVWYLSMLAMGLIALLFVVAIVRLVMYLISLAIFPRGFWLYPNLFEDVGFFDSFRPLYGWEEPKGAKGKKGKKGAKGKLAKEAPLVGVSTDESVASGAEVHATNVKKTHTPILEEVNDN